MVNFARNISKQMDVTEFEVDGYKFYIYPLPAFTAANLSGEVITLLAPLFGGIAGIFKESEKEGANENKSLMDMDISEAAPYIGTAFSHLSSDKMEYLLRKLLISGNVSVRAIEWENAMTLTEDLCNEVFCRNTQNMFIVAFMVLKVNYADFFAKIGTQSGYVKEILQKMGFPITEDLTPEDSVT